MKIQQVMAYPMTFPIPEEHQVQIGIGTTLKRDTVVVKVTTDEGLVGWGESHHARAAGAIAHLINTTLRGLVMGMDALDTTAVWARVYRFQLGSHGTGAAAAIGLSGIDLALWDIRAKAAGWPLYRLLGGGPRRLPAYAGGLSLGWQPPEQLAAEAQRMVSTGYTAIKLRVGDTPARDLERVARVRQELPGSVVLTDANTGYAIGDARAVLPGFEEMGVGWLEEPFPAHDYRPYQTAASWTTVPLAAGENHYTRFEFNRLIEDGAVTILQPDLSKCGGLTEALRIAAMASAWKLPIHPHTSMTGINMAATVHFLASIENAGYFETDASAVNPFRTDLTSTPYTLQPDGCVTPLDGPGIGVEVDEAVIQAHPIVEGSSYR